MAADERTDDLEGDAPPRFTDAMIAELIAESKLARAEAENYNRFFFRLACVAIAVAMVACVLCVILNVAL